MQVRFRSYFRDSVRVSVLAFLCEHAGVLADMCVGDIASSRAFVCVCKRLCVFFCGRVCLRVFVCMFFLKR